MVSIVIIENGAPQSKLVKALEGAKAISPDVSVIADLANIEAMNGVQVISSLSDGLAPALEQALARSSNRRVIIADARVFSFQPLKALAEEKSSAALTYVPLEIGGELYDLPDLGKERIVPILGLYSQLPLQFLSVDREFAKSRSLSGDTLTAIAADLLFRAQLEDEQVQRASSTARADSSYSVEELCSLSDRERAALLSTAVNSVNIEELFPNHAWKEHHEESAAAAYHSIAALFVRLGDAQSALECLALSDQLEDSPRSLALKGLIALDRGEVLGAVANMVSSLQQYENRKKNDGSHYLTFAPKDLERINTKLLQGLQALNKRDNMTAFNHFAEAVFSFDDFYRSFGVDKIDSSTAH